MFFDTVQFLYYKLKSDEKLLSQMKWLATACIVISAAVISFSVELSLQSSTFIGFLFAHILWTIAGVIMKDKPIIVLNACFIPIDIYAMIIRL